MASNHMAPARAWHGLVTLSQAQRGCAGVSQPSHCVCPAPLPHCALCLLLLILGTLVPQEVLRDSSPDSHSAPRLGEEPWSCRGGWGAPGSAGRWMKCEQVPRKAPKAGSSCCRAGGRCCWCTPWVTGTWLCRPLVAFSPAQMNTQQSPSPTQTPKPSPYSPRIFHAVNGFACRESR